MGPTENNGRSPFRAALGVLVAGVIVTASFFVTSPANAGHSLAVQPTSSAPFGVGVARCTFVDHTRNVLNYSTTPTSVLSNQRKLVTEIRYPTLSMQGEPNPINGAEPVAKIGGYPMIVFAHGYDVTPETFAPLLDAWVRAGFVVAAPFFPDENSFAVAAQHGANTENDIRNEPADMTFVTRALLLASAGQSSGCPVANGLVNASELGLAGHSDGATAVALLAFARGNNLQVVSYASLRAGLDYRAVVVMSGQEDGAQGYAAPASHPAFLDIQSAADQCNPIRNGVKLYVDIHQSNKWFLELHSAHHLPPFDGVDAPAFRVVASTSTRFFRIALQGATLVPGLVAYGDQNPPVAEMFEGDPGPSLRHAPNLPELCSPN
jgi:predicted dienelactone hydrolase